jgi:hypothetical protein
MTNRDRRRVIGGIFADTAKYSLTAGIVGGIISGNISIGVAAILGIVVALMGILAYVVTPVDKQ